MAPTLVNGDRVLARMGRPREFHRGDVLLVDAPRGGNYVVRVAGLPGDRIEIAGGIVILNGQPVAQHPLGVTRRIGPAERRQLAEQFPGETVPHEIYDTGDSEGDDRPVQVVAADRLFLLGDNRDNSNDSRFPADSYGLEQIPFDRVRGVPVRIVGSADPGRVGRVIH